VNQSINRAHWPGRWPQTLFSSFRRLFHLAAAAVLSSIHPSILARERKIQTYHPFHETCPFVLIHSRPNQWSTLWFSKSPWWEEQAAAESSLSSSFVLGWSGGRPTYDSSVEDKLVSLQMMMGQRRKLLNRSTKEGTRTPKRRRRPDSRSSSTTSAQQRPTASSCAEIGLCE
jgi:hypothetical protein